MLVINDAEFKAMADVVVDCAGHPGLLAHAAKTLRCGVLVVSASLEALADDKAYRQIEDIARAGGTRLHLASGAIGGLDALRRLGSVGLVRSYTSGLSRLRAGAARQLRRRQFRTPSIDRSPISKAPPGMQRCTILGMPT